LCIAAVWAYPHYRNRAQVAGIEEAVTAGASVTHFSDGSTMERHGSDAVVSVVEARPDRIVTSVEAGLAQFVVTPRPSRVFRVEAGNVSVEALGTIFTVERRDNGVGVGVLRGRVRVTWGAGMRELGVGETGWFPPHEDDTAADAQAYPTPAPAVAAALSATGSTGGAPPTAARSWKSLALEGKSDQAYELLRGRAAGVSNADDLMLAADVARLSGHPAEAVPFLERLLRDAKGSPQSAVAAFDLGRILMTSLGRPLEAAPRFAEAERQATGGSLAEDALAREVEAWARGGAADRARERAQEYVHRYPAGQRLHAVKTFGGIE
jgi:transmembrane sensor